MIEETAVEDLEHPTIALLKEAEEMKGLINEATQLQKRLNNELRLSNQLFGIAVDSLIDIVKQPGDATRLATSALEKIRIVNDMRDNRAI